MDHGLDVHAATVTAPPSASGTPSTAGRGVHRSLVAGSVPSGTGTVCVSTTIQLGALGERIAAAYLTDAGLRVLDRNWRCREGELDIVAREGDALVFCEVKTRRGIGFGHPVEAVDPGQAAPAAHSSRSAGWPRTTSTPPSCGSTSSACSCGPTGPALVTHLRAAFS